MYIDKIRLSNFRRFKDLNLEGFSKTNVICGSNGVGKTSIIEAIYVASTGKSFRNTSYRNLINHNENNFSIYLELKNELITKNIGMYRDKSGIKKIKKNQDICKSQSEIAHQLPVIAVDIDSYRFIDSPPQSKRTYLDWLVFHVEQSYLEIWNKVNICHKQLNMLYRSANFSEQLTLWEEKYIYCVNEMNGKRQDVFLLLKEKMFNLIKKFFPDKNEILIMLDQGWKEDLTIEEQLTRDRKKNSENKKILNGPHKMNFLIRECGKTASHVLSRGQKKILSVLFYLASMEIIYEQKKIMPIFCLDDIGAELDKENKEKLLNYIEKKPYQIFLTTVDDKEFVDDMESPKMFHVEH